MTSKPASRYLPHRDSEGWLIFVLLVLYALAYLDRQVISLLLDPIGRDLGVSDVEMGFLQGLGFVLFFALCGPALGWMADRYPRRPIIWAGVTVWSICTACGGLAHSYNELLLARFGVGAGEAALLPAAYSMISDRVTKNRLAKSMALFSLGSIIGGAMSYGLGGGAITLANRFEGAELPWLGPVHAWQLVFLAIGLLGIPLALLIFTVAEPVRRESPKVVTATTDQGHLRRHWRFYLFHFAGFSMICLASAAHVAWAATYMLRHYHWPVGQVGTVLAGISLVAGGAGMYGSAALADWLYRKGYRDAHLRLYTVAVPVMALAGALTYSGLGGLPATLAGLTVLGLSVPFIAVAASALQLGTPPERRGLVSAVFLMIYNIVGFGLGPATAALIARHWFNNAIGGGLVALWVIITPLVVLLMRLGMPAMRKAVDEVTV